MIDQEIIDKLKLRDEGVHHGESFIHNCQILTWPIRKTFKVYVMDCDLEGKPLENNTLNILWKFQGKHGLMTVTVESIANDIMIDWLLQQIPGENAIPYI